MTIAAFSPILGVGELVYNILLAESCYSFFGFHYLFEIIESYKGIDFFIFSSFQVVFVTLFALYLFYVLPLSIGVPSHPLFFLNCFRRKKHAKI